VRFQTYAADADAIVHRAERRLGQLMDAQAKAVGKAKGGDKGGKRSIAGLRKNPANAPPTLKEAGIDKNLAKRARSISWPARSDATEFQASPLAIHPPSSIPGQKRGHPWRGIQQDRQKFRCRPIGTLTRRADS
jgi:hypothetical protein